MRRATIDTTRDDARHRVFPVLAISRAELTATRGAERLLLLALFGVDRLGGRSALRWAASPRGQLFLRVVVLIILHGQLPYRTLEYVGRRGTYIIEVVIVVILIVVVDVLERIVVVIEAVFELQGLAREPVDRARDNLRTRAR